MEQILTITRGMYLAKSTTAMTMSRALVKAAAHGGNLTEASPGAVIFAMTVFFDIQFRRIGILWVHIAPPRITCITTEDVVKINFTPICEFRIPGFGRWSGIGQKIGV
jgi:hypothetical protein